MQTNRTDAFDPKLQDHYRLQQALTLIEQQDLIISRQATDIQYLKNVTQSMQESSRKAFDLFQGASKALVPNIDRHSW